MLCECENRVPDVLILFFKVTNVNRIQISDGELFQALGSDKSYLYCLVLVKRHLL